MATPDGGSNQSVITVSRRRLIQRGVQALATGTAALASSGALKAQAPTMQEQRLAGLNSAPSLEPRRELPCRK